MINPGMAARFFDRCDILRIFNHADNPLVATRIRTNMANLLIREIVADAAKDDALAELFDELPKRERVLFIRFQEMKDHALG